VGVIFPIFAVRVGNANDGCWHVTWSMHSEKNA